MKNFDLRIASKRRWAGGSSIFGLTQVSRMPRPPSVGGTAFTLTNTISYLGETFTLNQNAKVGYTLNGQPFIVSDTPGLTWVSSSTPSALVNVSGTNYRAHGAEFDPWWISPGTITEEDTPLFTGAQGVSEYWSTLVSRSAAYASAKNVDPGNTGTPWSIPVGTCGRLVKVVQRAGLVAGNLTIPQKILHINIVPSVPPAGAIAPIYNGAGGVEWLTSFNKNVFRGGGYVSGQTTLSACIAAGYLPATDWPFYIANGEQRRGIIPYSLEWTSGYSRDFGARLAEVINACHAEGAAAVSDSVAYYLATQGCLLIENVRRGNVQRGGAGQNSGMKPLAALVGMASGNTTILSQSQQYEGNETHQQFYVSSAFFGAASGFPNGAGNGGFYRKTFTPDDVGRSVFFHGNQALPPSPTAFADLYDASAAVRYQYTAGQASNLGISAILQLQNGPGGIDGAGYVLQGGANNPATNPYASTLTYWREYATAIGDVDIAIQPFTLSWHRTLLARVFANYVNAPAQPPAAVTPVLNTAAYASAAAGGITYDWRNVGHYTDAVTQWDNRYTLDDGRTFLVENNVASNGTRSGLPIGVSIGVQFRRRSASGIGPWSVNFPRTIAGVPGAATNPRLVLQPTGTPTGTPTNVQAPQIMYQPYPLATWYFEPWTGMAAQNQVLNGGVGWWTGDLVSPGRLVKWQRGTTDIAGATSLDYTVTSADAGQTVRFGVSYDGGATWVFSSSVSIATPVYPSMSLTAFDGTNDYLDRTSVLAGAANGRKFTFSVTGALTGADGVLKRIVAFGRAGAGTTTVDNLLQIDRTSTNAINVVVRNTAGTTIFNGTTVANAWRTTDGEVTFTVSIDFDTARYQVCINNTVIAWAAAPTVTVENISWASAARPRLFASLSGTADLQFNHRCTFFHTDSLDLSVLANRNKLLPANIGNRGEGVFGVDALVMLFGPAASIGTNYGTGGNYTLVGAVTDV